METAGEDISYVFSFSCKQAKIQNLFGDCLYFISHENVSLLLFFQQIKEKRRPINELVFMVNGSIQIHQKQLYVVKIAHSSYSHSIVAGGFELMS